MHSDGAPRTPIQDYSYLVRITRSSFPSPVALYMETILDMCICTHISSGFVRLCCASGVDGRDAGPASPTSTSSRMPLTFAYSYMIPVLGTRALALKFIASDDHMHCSILVIKVQERQQSRR